MVRKTRNKRICCAGPGCPEWKHCIHVLGDGAKYRPKSKASLKRLKARILETNKRKRKHNVTKRARKSRRTVRRKVRRKSRRKTRKRRSRNESGGDLNFYRRSHF